jgi:thiol:disulfide interchange protein DsbD
VLKSLAFACGVMAVFMLLAGLASFANFTWGKQFQDPAALIAIIAIIEVFSLGLFDVYSLIVPAALSNLPQRRSERFAGIFFQGVFATLLATPCSGPFLGAVLAWSVTRHPPVIFMVYGALGFGMALPYIILSISRSLAKWIPKPGPWMEDGKRIMGFLLLAMAAWLLAGLPAQRIPGAIFFCLAVAFAVAVYARLAPWNASLLRRSVALLAALAIAAGGGYLSFVEYHPSFSRSNPLYPQERGEASLGGSGVWQVFSPDSLIRANGEGRTVIVDFTASWCLNCQYNFAAALNTPEVTGLIARKNILALKADLTSPNPAADSLLHALGSQSLPFLAIFPGETPGEPIVMRDIIVKSALIKVLGKVK